MIASVPRNSTEAQTSSHASLSRSSTALQGATLAFGKLTARPRVQVNAHNGLNGALTPASQAGTNARSGSLKVVTSALPRSNDNSPGEGEMHDLGTGDLEDDSEITRAKRGLQQRHDGAVSRLQIGEDASNGVRSPSQIAATIAAAKSASGLASLHTSNAVPTAAARRLSAQIRSLSRSRNRVESPGGPEETPIPPTESLIKMFEETSAVQSLPLKIKTGSQQPKLNSDAIPIYVVSPPPIQSPKPIRLHSRAIPSTAPTCPAIKHIKDEEVVSTPRLMKLDPHTRTLREYDESNSTSEDDESYPSASEKVDAFQHRPSQLTRGRPGPSVSVRDKLTIEAMANAIVASSLASSRTTSPIKSQLSGTSAMAQQRNVSSIRRPSIFHMQLHHHSLLPKNGIRTPSPMKGMRQTLRNPSPSSIDRSARGSDSLTITRAKSSHRTHRNPLSKKHPNKHHEGDRKRWRDELTDRERKRYEAVWASNKGLFLVRNPPALYLGPDQTPPLGIGIRGDTDEPTSAHVNADSDASAAIAAAAAATQSQEPRYPHAPAPAASLVANVVVRDIWSRSRLGADVLAETWALVDRSGRGALCKDEFVAGMWLIDQRLKGRKLPSRVSESVWSSIGLGGVRVRAVGRARKG